MALPPLTEAQMQAAVDAMITGEGMRVAAAKLLNMSVSTFKHHLNEAARRGIVPSAAALRKPPESVPHLKAKLKGLEEALRNAEKGALTHTMIKAEIIKLADGERLAGASGGSSCDAPGAAGWAGGLAYIHP